jgi:hypothetical protein
MSDTELETAAEAEAVHHEQPQPQAPTLSLTYQPHHHDADETTVHGVTFKAYEPVELPDDKRWLVTKLRGNPWFTDGEVDAARHDEWKAIREAQAQAAALREEADRLVKDAIESGAQRAAELRQQEAAKRAELKPADAE